MWRKPTVRKIVVCVDGTWYNADGQEGKGKGNNSNVFRIFASIKQGTVSDDGTKVEQLAEYFHGIGVRKKPLDKFNDGITGEGCKELIQEVYQYCCEKVQSPSDELWLFGFSRGAYVVRAVSALLNSMAALTTSPTGQFRQDYQLALKLMVAKQKDQIASSKGELYRFLSQKTRDGPVIQFLGLFDTVKQIHDEIEFDISYSKHIKYVRQALAMNEERYRFLPEAYNTNAGDKLSDSSLIQAWFVGTHADIGGGARDDGLSLYPLQWMLSECRKYGLVLEHKPEKRFANLIANPLELVFPRAESDNESVKSGESVFDLDPFQEWNFKYSNSIEVTMYDLRSSHSHGNLQKWQNRKLQKRGHVAPATHRVRLNPGPALPSIHSGKRMIFHSTELKGYVTDATYGTIIHPSVYFLQDTYPNLGIKEAIEGIKKGVNEFRDQIESVDGNKYFPWILQRDFAPRYQEFRILICGKSGVGKSTLLNRIFGFPMSVVSDNSRGVHDIDEGFESDQHPGIIIHDSEGFESGDIKGIKAFEAFLKKRSSRGKIREQIHAVWICNEVRTSRPVETALETVLKIMAKLTPEVPVFIVGTKKDELLIIEGGMAKDRVEALEKGQGSNGERETQTRLLGDKKALWQQLLEKECEKEVEELDIKFAFVSQDDLESVKSLMYLTLEPISSEAVYSGAVAAQIVDMDLKIQLAVDETVRLLCAAVTTASVGSGLVFTSAVSTPSYSRILCSTIVRCYGLAAAKNHSREEEIDHLMHKVVWSNLAPFMAQTVTQTVLIWSGVAALTLFTYFGGIPLAASAPLLEAPAAARMIVKCACDLVIIIDRSFQFGGKQMTGAQIQRASMEYLQPPPGPGEFRSRRRQVHQEINDLIPTLSSLSIKIHKKSFLSKLGDGIREIIAAHCIRPDESPLGAEELTPDSSHDSGEQVERLCDIPEDQEDLIELFPKDA